MHATILKSSLQGRYCTAFGWTKQLQSNNFRQRTDCRLDQIKQIKDICSHTEMRL